ncbi:MAG TPA: hypothetical protein VGU90_13920, partial [Terriglobales bacterium]|nr:hypothetical protein [Terriglobales bacterium]
MPIFELFEYSADSTVPPTSSDGLFTARERLPEPNASLKESPATLDSSPGEASSVELSNVRSQESKPADFNRAVYYRNKLEFSLEGGWLPINVPFPLDVFVGAAYNSYPLQYTLIPII